MKDFYKTIQEESIGEFKDRGSKFLAYAYPVYDEVEWQYHLENLKKEHFKARHHCYAYRLGLDGTQFRANDDGEPSGTAGRPILGQIDSFDLTNIIVIVIRYYGGTKLGTSGLINAYKESTMDALGHAQIIEKLIEDIYQITFDYSLMSNVMNTIKKLNLKVVSQDFGNNGLIEFAVRQSEVDTTLLNLKAGIAQVQIDHAKVIESIAGLKLKYLRTS